MSCRLSSPTPLCLEEMNKCPRGLKSASSWGQGHSSAGRCARQTELTKCFSTLARTRNTSKAPGASLPAESGSPWYQGYKKYSAIQSRASEGHFQPKPPRPPVAGCNLWPGQCRRSGWRTTWALPSLLLEQGMDGKGGASAAGWHCSARTAWVSPERDSLTADFDSLRKLRQDLLLASQPVSYFQPK